MIGNWFQTKYKICKFCFDFVLYVGSAVVLNFDVYNQNSFSAFCYTEL